MVPVSILLFLASGLGLVHSMPFAPVKRISEITADSLKDWEQACRRGGGAQDCRERAVRAFPTLLAAALPCDQQNTADDLVDFGKQLTNNTAEMTKFAQIFVRQPADSPNALSRTYCQQPPRNPELNGLYQCQWQGSEKQNFIGGLKLGDPGTIPLGSSAPVNPPGSSLASPEGPVPDGVQLVSLTQDPGVGRVPNGGGGSSAQQGGEGSVRGAGAPSFVPPVIAASSTFRLVAPSSTAAPVDGSRQSTAGEPSGSLQTGEVPKQGFNCPACRDF